MSNKTSSKKPSKPIANWRDKSQYPANVSDLYDPDIIDVCQCGADGHDVALGVSTTSS